MAPSLNKGPKESSKPAREVVHEELSSLLFSSDNPLKAEEAMEILGWEETKEKDFLFIDRNKTKIVCRNNDHNRPFNLAWAIELGQSILNGHYKINGETIIISRTGVVKSGQHRLIGLILAKQCWEKGIGLKGGVVDWKKICPNEPTIETFVSVGIDDSPETARTLDNVRPRTGADTLFAETETYFKKYGQTDRKKLCRIAEYAVRLLWHRTGAENDAWAPKLTNSNLGDFIARHPKVTKAVEHIFTEYNGKEKIGKLMPPGSAAGLLYLMATGKSEQESYLKAETRTEKKLSFDLWDDAEAFWTELVGDNKRLTAIRDKLYPLEMPLDGMPLEYSLDEKLEVFALAWGVYRQGKAVKESDLGLEYTDVNGIRSLRKSATFDGIDLGDPTESEHADPDVSEEGVAKRTAEIRKKKDEAAAAEYETTTNEQGEELVGVKPKPGKKKKPADKKKPSLIGGKK